MTLKSPRFINETELKRVDNGQSLLKKGAKGRHVHLVQMALVDLGFPMPISSKSASFSPDGDYGNETTEAVRKFQKSIVGLVCTFGRSRSPRSPSTRSSVRRRQSMRSMGSEST